MSIYEKNVKNSMKTAPAKYRHSYDQWFSTFFCPMHPFQHMSECNFLLQVYFISCSEQIELGPDKLHEQHILPSNKTRCIQQSINIKNNIQYWLYTETVLTNCIDVNLKISFQQVQNIQIIQMKLCLALHLTRFEYIFSD